MSDILSHTEGGVCTLTLNRLQRKNSLTAAMYAALADALEHARDDAAVRVVVLQGHETVFSAGNDIGDFLATPPTSQDAPVFRFLRAISTFAKPLVASVCGPAVGIGTTMLLHCDVVVTARDAKLQMPFVRLGLVPEGGSSVLLARRVGQARANWWLLSGEAFSGASAAEAGLALETVDDDAVDATARRYAEQLATLPPGAYAESKRLLREPQAVELEAVMDAERAAFSARLQTPEAQAIFAGFFARKAG